jgi:hypothetical protein
MLVAVAHVHGSVVAIAVGNAMLGAVMVLGLLSANFLRCCFVGLEGT